jgi:3D (Asp-Asp-Asp) domain-containing protein
MKVLILFLVISLISSSPFFSQENLFAFDVPTDSTSTDTLEMWATEYYVHQMRSNGNLPFLDANNDTLGYYGDTCDFCTACLEGTVFIADGNGTIVLNYDTVAAKPLINCRKCARFKNSSLKVESWGRVRWKISTGYGEGVEGYKLVPYRTIAVDPTNIPYGTIVYIPQAKGVSIPVNDSVTLLHDGYFFAGDTGSAIKKNHIDVFTGTDDSHPFDFVKSNAKKTFELYLIQDEAIRASLLVLHI